MLKSKHGTKKGTFKYKDIDKSNSFNNKMKEVKVKTPETPEECALVMPILKTTDKKNLHCFSAVLSRNMEEGIGMEDLDRLQLELETLLSAVAVRARVLRGEICTLSSAEELRDKRGKLALYQKKKRLEEKMLLENSLKDSPKYCETSQIIQPTKSKSKSSNGGSKNPAVSNDLPIRAVTVMEPSKMFVPKNDTTNKFWASVEPYCAEISSDDMNFLQDLITSCEKETEIGKIPALGRHYTQRWADEDMQEEKEASTMNKLKRKASEPFSSEAKEMLKRAERFCSREKIPGPLVQRLVSALMEENFTTPLQESFAENKLKAGEGNAVPQFFRKLPSYHTSACFERRIRKELEASGLFDSHDIPKEENDDEVLAEIKKCQEELRIISEHNVEQLKKIQQLAKQEMTRQDIRMKLKLVDNEILDIYRKRVALKLKKEAISKQENDQAWKALKEREALQQSLDSGLTY